MKIPRPEDLHPPLREALKKDADLSLSMGPLTAKAADLRAKERERRDYGSDNQVDNNRVRALTGEPPLADASTESELKTVLLALQDHQAARGRLAGIIQKERAFASRMLCETVKPEVTKRAKAFAAAFLGLHAAQHSYHTYLDAIQDTGASIGSIPNVFINGLGSARDPSGTLAYGVKDFIEAGYLSPSDMPKELRP